MQVVLSGLLFSGAAWRSPRQAAAAHAALACRWAVGQSPPEAVFVAEAIRAALIFSARLVTVTQHRVVMNPCEV